ncbi:MAG: glycosyltransferase family 2 protein [Ignavibacteriae bacterium]|nr:glycosyltransferase family 2 protein [Ignavibacteriota bacterium]
MKNERKVAGVVVIYKPENNIFENINTYINQIDYLFIIDNSKEECFETKTKIHSIEKVKYIFNNDNIGIAAALNIAARKASEKGFSFLLTMDQDSRAPKNMVENLLNIYEKKENIGIVSPLHSNRYNTHLKFENENDEVKIAMTSGNLLSLEVFKKVGEFRSDFFIDYVDIEFCFRLQLNSYKIIRANRIILEHNEADLSSKKILNKTFYPLNHKPFRLYYKTRNLLYLRSMYKNSLPHLLKIEYDSFYRTLLKIILFEKQKFLKIKMILIGMWDYYNSIKGRKF